MARRKRKLSKISAVKKTKRNSIANEKHIMETPTNPDGNANRENQKINEVFENKFLRELILGYVIRQGSSISCADVCSVRLVQKTWLRAVNRLALKHNLSLFHVKLTAENSLKESQYVQDTGHKLLDHFVVTMEHSVDNLIPPFSLEICQEFFCDENHHSFSNFLTSSVCANGLMQLDIHVPRHGGSMTLIFPQSVFFHSLKVLHVIFCVRDLVMNHGGVITTAARNNGSNFNFVPFLEFICSKAVVMYVFSLSSARGSVVPAGIKYLSLPTSLTKLSADAALNERKLQMLTQRSLPHLTFLSFSLNEAPVPDSFIFQILENVQSTLRHLKLNKVKMASPLQETKKHLLRLPVMACLQSCEINSMVFKLDTHNAVLQQLLPKLKVLKLNNLTWISLEEWTENNCFSTVTDIHIDWLYETTSPRCLFVFTKDDMQAVRMAFPNLQRFSFFSQTCCSISGKALQYLFQNMRQLKFLSVGLRKSNLENAVFWDSLLCGIPISVASALSDNPELWNYIELKQSSDFPSIKNLTALQGLKLYTDKYASSSQPLISNLSFHHAFKRMPNLKTILLQGRFTPSEEITTLASTHKSTQCDQEIYFSSL